MSSKTLEILKLGSMGQYVRQVQILLNSILKPHPNLKVDGKFGPKSVALLKTFQRQAHLKSDGEVGAKTRKALGLQPVQQVAPKPPPTHKNWLDIAYAEKDVRADATPGKHNNRIVAYHATTTLKATDDETAWCSSFVNWVVTQAGQNGTNSAAAKSWLEWKGGRTLTSPEKGCIIVIKRKAAGYSAATGSLSGYHVGFYVSSPDPAHVRIFGGNQNGGINHWNVPLSQYDVMGYRGPR
ncbi:MAG TPA: TIGR02594 family protein [Allosphingosinicella sp.]|jgi:uncharacterized protein (TIGR02594 family)